MKSKIMAIYIRRGEWKRCGSLVRENLAAEVEVFVERARLLDIAMSIGGFVWLFDICIGIVSTCM